MFIVYFETKVHAEIIGLVNPDVYDDIYPALEKWAEKNGGSITETLCDADDIDEKGYAIGYVNGHFNKAEE